MRRLVAVCVLIATVALAGCTNPDASSTAHSTPTISSPQNLGEPAAPPPPSPVAQAPLGVEPTPEKALAGFASLYVNWTYRTLTANQRTLAAISVGAARLAEQQAAVASQADTTISRGHIFNHGQIASIAPDLARSGLWVIVTREQTGGDAQYEGLKPAYHVTVAAVVSVPGGYAVSQWLPQD